MSISKYSLPTYPSYCTYEDVMSSEYDAYSTTPVKVYIKVEEDYIMSSKEDYYLEYPIFVKILDIYIAEDAIINGYHYCTQIYKIDKVYEFLFKGNINGATTSPLSLKFIN